MKYSNKVKKSVDKKTQDKIIKWEIELYDNNWERVEIIPTESKYKYKLSNKKEFMKKWTDRKLNVTIKKSLSLLEKEVLFDLLDYIDTNNIINFKLLANDYSYSPSKISKARSLLIEKLLVKKLDGIYYLNPIIWIKAKEIPQELIELFEDSFEKYNIEINYK